MPLRIAGCPSSRAKARRTFDDTPPSMIIALAHHLGQQLSGETASEWRSSPVLHGRTDWILRTQSARRRVDQPTITGRSRLAPAVSCHRDPPWSASASVGHQATGRDLLLGRIFGCRLLDHRQDHVVVGGVPVGRDAPVLAVPGLRCCQSRPTMPKFAVPMISPT
jgi:hypothetical protein